VVDMRFTHLQARLGNRFSHHSVTVSSLLDRCTRRVP